MRPLFPNACELHNQAKIGKVPMGGRSSVAERQLPKLNVVGSIPIARSRLAFPSAQLLSGRLLARRDPTRTGKRCSLAMPPVVPETA